jgi:hypothetical protein
MEITEEIFEQLENLVCLFFHLHKLFYRLILKITHSNLVRLIKQRHPKNSICHPCVNRDLLIIKQIPAFARMADGKKFIFQIICLKSKIPQVD